MCRLLRLVVLCLSGCFLTHADSISIVGELNAADPNDVFLVEFYVFNPGTVSIQSWGYGGGTNAGGTVIPDGGFDAYFSLFSGLRPTAGFLASDDDSGCPPAGGLICRDPALHLSGLVPGPYTLAVTTFGNISFAENYGTGTISDGFVGLGNFDDRTAAFAVDIVGDVSLVPEPSHFLPVLLCAIAFICTRIPGRLRAR